MHQEELLDKKPKKPTNEQISEVIQPDLSKEKFKIGDKEFQYKLLPIAVEKKFTRAIGELTQKLGLNDTDSFVQIIASNIDLKLNSVADLLVDLVLVVCQNQDASFTREYIENNAHTKQLFDIVVEQLRKQELLGIIMGFINGMVKKTGAPSPTN